VAISLLALSAAQRLVGCFGPDYWTVHFRGDRPDFFQMPQPWRGYPGENRALPHYSDNVYDREDQDRKNLIARAIRCEAGGQYQQAAAVWERYRRARGEEEPGDRGSNDEPAQCLALEDRITALRAWRGPQDSGALWLYLDARDRLNAVGNYAVAEPLLTRLPQGPYRTRAEYLAASERFYTRPPDVSAEAFRAFLKRHPRDPLATYMVGRCYIRAILAGEANAAENLAPDRRQHYLREALAAYDACASLTPRHLLSDDARDMASACLFRLGNYAEALARYCRQLAELPPGRDNPDAFLSARMCLERMTLADHRTFQALTVSRPEVAAVYLDLHLHYGRPGVRASANLGRFALAVLQRHRAAPLSGRILQRLAVLEGRLGRWERAERLAAAAMERCPPGAYRDQARWEHALALRQLRHPREALAEYERLADGAVAGNMRRGAHEAAAILSEEQGDLPNAVRHYFALEYRPDYGYLVDAVASQDDLRAFLRRFPGHPRARLIRYSLGFRQLRAGQYDAAIRTFTSLGSWLDVAEKAYDCRTIKDKPRMPPLQLSRFLADSIRREAAAHAAAEKARIAYRRAQILFQQRYLAFYNGALWKGEREFILDIDGPGSTFGGMDLLSPSQQRVFDRYEEKHAPLYQALRIFERIGRDYPNTPEAPKALYSAALCWSFLSSMDRHWKERSLNYDGKQIALYRRIQRDYPRDPLAAAAAKYGGPLPSLAPRKERIARKRTG
jgi:TolA-binding protein